MNPQMAQQIQMLIQTLAKAQQPQPTTPGQPTNMGTGGAGMQPQQIQMMLGALSKLGSGGQM